jgi:hypothetical protein
MFQNDPLAARPDGVGDFRGRHCTHCGGSLLRDPLDASWVCMLCGRPAAPAARVIDQSVLPRRAPSRSPRTRSSEP